jgi:hypothetical protein
MSINILGKELADWDATPFVKSWMNSKHRLATDTSVRAGKVNHSILGKSSGHVEFTVKNIVCFHIICILVATHILGTNKIYNEVTYIYTGVWGGGESPLLNIYHHTTAVMCVPVHNSPGVDSASNRNEYQESSWG